MSFVRLVRICLVLGVVATTIALYLVNIPAIEYENSLRWGIHLTQVTPRCSMGGSGELPTESDRVRGSIFQR